MTLILDSTAGMLLCGSGLARESGASVTSILNVPPSSRASPLPQLIVVSVTEVAHAGEDHGDAGFVSGCNHFVVTHRAARLDHRSDADLGCVVDAVAEREERVRGHDRTLHLQTGMFSLDGS